MSTAVLLLNADYTPIKVISWERAVSLLLDEKARMVEEYAGKAIHSANLTLAFPAVVALVRYAKASTKVRFSRANVLARDGYQCQYCGCRPRTTGGFPRIDDLTVDHVVPRAQSRGGKVVLPWSRATVSVTCWENITTACVDCNRTKADRTPAEAKMTLRAIPKRPGPWDTVLMAFVKAKIPDEWKSFIPETSGWRDYWDGELDPD